MDRRSFLRVFSSLTMLGLGGSGSSLFGAPVSGSLPAGITAQMRADDQRLSRPVTEFTLPKTTIREFLQKLSASTGVELRVLDHPTGSADIAICALIHQATLGDVLDGLYSLESYQGAKWSWRRQRENGKFMYVLLPTLYKDALVTEVRREIQADFEAQEDILRAALKMTSAQLAEAAKTNTNIKVYLSHNTARERDALNSFFESLDKQQRLRVFRGESITIPLSSAPESAQRYAINRWKAEGPADPAPTTLTFHGGYDPVFLTPTLSITPERQMGLSTIGNGFGEEEWHKRIARRWVLPDESATDTKQEASVLQKLVPPAPLTGFEEDHDARLIQLLWKTWKGSTASLLANLPQRSPNQDYGQIPTPYIPVFYDEPYGRKLGQILTDMDQLFANYSHKWRNGILLISHTATPFQRGQVHGN